MATKIPGVWHTALSPELSTPGVCLRCGTLYQTDAKKHRKLPELELCTYCDPIGKQEFADENK